MRTAGLLPLNDCHFSLFKMVNLKSGFGCSLVCRLVAILLASIVCFKGATAAPVASPEIDMVMVTLLKTLETAKSIEFESQTIVTETEVFRELARLGPGKDGGRVVDLAFQSNGAKYRYTKTIREFEEVSGSTLEYAFDGENFQVFHPDAGILRLRKSDPLGRHLRLGFSNPLNQFGFLSGQINGVEPTISWDLVKNVKAWKSVFAGAVFLKHDTIDNNRCVLLKFDGGLHKVFQVPCWYIVAFDLDKNMFPIRWEAVDKNGRQLEDFSVTDFQVLSVGEVRWFLPKKSTMRWYTKEKYPDGTLQGTFITSVSKIEFNTAIEDDSYSIDPMKASRVFDEDNEVSIQVPK